MLVFILLRLFQFPRWMGTVGVRDWMPEMLWLIVIYWHFRKLFNSFQQTKIYCILLGTRDSRHISDCSSCMESRDLKYVHFRVSMSMKFFQIFHPRFINLDQSLFALTLGGKVSISKLPISFWIMKIIILLLSLWIFAFFHCILITAIFLVLQLMMSQSRPSEVLLNDFLKWMNELMNEG